MRDYFLRKRTTIPSEPVNEGARGNFSAHKRAIARTRGARVLRAPASDIFALARFSAELRSGSATKGGGQRASEGAKGLHQYSVASYHAHSQRACALGRLHMKVVPPRSTLSRAALGVRMGYV